MPQQDIIAVGDDADNTCNEKNCLKALSHKTKRSQTHLESQKLDKIKKRHLLLLCPAFENVAKLTKQHYRKGSKSNAQGAS